VIRKFVVVAAVGLLASLPAKEAASGSIAFVSVPLAKVVSDSRLIVIASVEQVETFIPTTTRTGDPGIKYFAVRIEEVLKSTEAEAPKNLKGSPIVVFDPQEVFYHEHADMIAAGVISFVDPRYPTKVPQVAAGDRLVFFLAGRDKQLKLPRPDAHFLVCGRAYDRLDIKRAVLRRLK
jgi:hypothetical protein